MLVSAIMVTRGRPGYAKLALECFRAQTYPDRELIIIDDADSPSFSVPQYSGPCYQLETGVWYTLLHRKLTIGAKRNLACSRAAGEVILHWDDDDYSAPGRIADQIERLQRTAARVTGYHSMLFVDEDGNAWKYSGSHHYALGTSLCYTREFWRTHPFKDKNEGEDNDMVYAASREIVTADAGELMYARIHSGNTSDKTRSIRAGDNEWKRLR